jgi:anti-sigma factor RsiW
VTHDCGLGHRDLGPYLLGHLPAEEVTRVEAALADCPICTEEVSQLLPTVAAMAAVVSYEPTLSSLPPASLDRVLGTIGAHRRSAVGSLRAALAVAAVVIALACGIAGFALGVGRHRSHGETVRLVSATGANARVVLDQRTWGTAITIEVRGLTPGVTYGAWLARPDGKRVPAGSFRPDAKGWAQLELGAALSRSDSGSLGVTALGGADVLSTNLSQR